MFGRIIQQPTECFSEHKAEYEREDNCRDDLYDKFLLDEINGPVKILEPIGFEHQESAEKVKQRHPECDEDVVEAESGRLRHLKCAK